MGGYVCLIGSWDRTYSVFDVFYPAKIKSKSEISHLATTKNCICVKTPSDLQSCTFTHGIINAVVAYIVSLYLLHTTTINLMFL